MATERTRQSDEHSAYPDELDPPITDDVALPPITAEDIAHVVERLEAGREAGEYTNMRTSDLIVIWSIPRGRWEDVRANPALLWQLVTPTAHA